MRALILGMLILFAGAAFEYAGQGSLWCWQARAEAREMAREQITAKREVLRAQAEAKREAARARLDFARERRDFLREQGRLRREAVREVEREFRHDWRRLD
jgi:uncharacterized protein HemX